MAQQTEVTEMRDCEYGDYKDMNNERGWWDDFNPSNKAVAKAYAKYKTFWYDILDDIAIDNHLDTSDWEVDDYQMFAEIMDL